MKKFLQGSLENIYPTRVCATIFFLQAEGRRISSPFIQKNCFDFSQWKHMGGVKRLYSMWPPNTLLLLLLFQIVIRTTQRRVSGSNGISQCGSGSETTKNKSREITSSPRSFSLLLHWSFNLHSPTFSIVFITSFYFKFCYTLFFGFVVWFGPCLGGIFVTRRSKQHLLRIYGTTDIDPLLLLLLSSDVGYFSGELDDYWKCFFLSVSFSERIRPERDSFQFA